MSDPTLIALLTENRQSFLAFLTRRLGSEAVAEEVLQEAFVKGLEKASTLRETRNTVAWFYRLLRNAIVDHYRHQAAESSALQQKALQQKSDEDLITEDAELKSTVCACILRLTATLKPEQAAILRGVDLEGASVAGFAQAAGISANNASVRLHRARLTLAQRVLESCGDCCRQGCAECECEPDEEAAEGPQMASHEEWEKKLEAGL